MSKAIKVLAITVVMFFMSSVVNAQLPGGPGAQGGPAVPGDSGKSGVPFDGGLSLILIAAGAGLAKRKTYKVSKTL